MSKSDEDFRIRNMVQQSRTPERGPWQQTYTGRAFYPADPRPEEVNVEDIAHALSLTCRYNGHCEEFYSVAQHAVWCSHYVEQKLLEKRSYQGLTAGDWRVVFTALHHDDEEAYTGDIVTQIKSIVPEVKPMIQKVNAAVSEAFGLVEPEPHIVKIADLTALATERRDIMAVKQLWVPETWAELPTPSKTTIVPWSPDDAEQEYLDRNEEVAINIAAEERFLVAAE